MKLKTKLNFKKKKTESTQVTLANLGHEIKITIEKIHRNKL